MIDLPYDDIVGTFNCMKMDSIVHRCFFLPFDSSHAFYTAIINTPRKEVLNVLKKVVVLTLVKQFLYFVDIWMSNCWDQSYGADAICRFLELAAQYNTILV